MGIPLDVPAWVEIDRTALRHNYDFLRGCLSDRVQMMPAVKANAYGHGAIAIAHLLVSWGVERLAIATLVEGVALRDAGIRIPILMTRPILRQEIASAIAYDLEFLLMPQDLGAIEAIATSLGKAAHVHLKLETGMGRAGLSLTDAKALLLYFAGASESSSMKVENSPWDGGKVHLIGVMTHFSSADEDENWTRRQIRIFDDFLREVPQSILRHASNTAGMLFFPEARYDCVRPGIGLYGYGHPDLKPVLSLKARLIDVRRSPAERVIGYGNTFSTSEESWIGLLGLGYADGLPRGLANRALITWENNSFPLVGRVSMDSVAASFGQTQPAIGDVVTLIGDGITADDWASLMGTISYEILCGLDRPRLPKFLV